MSFVLTLLSSSPYLNFPHTLWGRVFAAAGWILFLAIDLALLWRWRGYDKPRTPRNWGIFILLAVLVPLTSLFFGIRLPAEGALSPPGVPIEPYGPALMVFAALPWILAGGLLGPTLSVVLAAFSGGLLALWGTHSPFAPLELALLAILFSAAVNQRYRTRIYALFRHPIFTTVVLTIIYPLIFLGSTALTVDGTLAIRLDYALNLVWPTTLALGGMLLLGGMIAEVVAIALPEYWGIKGGVLPSPSEKSLLARFLYTIAPLAILLALAMIIGSWLVAEDASERILHEGLEKTALVASEGIPYFLETGQNLIKRLAADPRLYTSDPETLGEILSEDLRVVPFFTQLYVLDETGKSLAGYPVFDYPGVQAPREELDGIQRALEGIPFQTYTVPPEEGGTTAEVSFLAAIFDAAGDVQGVLVGRTDLDSNPFTQPIISSLVDLEATDGEGMLLDEDRRILYHPNPSLLMSTYTGKIPEEADFFEDKGSDGTRRLIYYQPALGRPWAVVLSVPAQSAQQLALRIAAPLLLMIVVLVFVSVIILRLALRNVTRSLQNLAIQADNIAQGELNTPMPTDGIDEIGQLRRAFEKMRVSLKARLDELNQLLIVSQGVASSLEMSEAVQPVLESALSTGASTARVVLVPSLMPDLDNDPDSPISYGAGSVGNLYAYLDDQILTMMRQQDRVVLNNLGRPRLLRISPGNREPHALLAVALHHENLYYGALWVAFDRPHSFSDQEVDFFVTLAGHAALAAANSRHYLNAEIGRQQLAAILASTPDPVLVTDHQNRLLLVNPAAWRALGLGVEWKEGQPIEQVITQDELLVLLSSVTDEKRSVEVALLDGRVYYATATKVLAEGRSMGRVCVLRDITSFKQVDALKSEFVATVSHDLRSPLTLMRGYATMLEMVGDLNEQQSNYVLKIISGVESMSSLVNNLLDLGRIESGVDLQLEMISAQEIADRVVSSLQAQATQRQVQLKYMPQEEIPHMQADPALVQHALNNLVENAIKYSESGGEVNVRVNAHKDYVIYEVSDHGIGIAPVDQPRLFEKFFRGAQQTDKQQRGSGLGLAIVKSVAERHAGRVWFKSQLGKGSTFYMAIPLRQPILSPDE